MLHKTSDVLAQETIHSFIQVGEGICEVERKWYLLSHLCIQILQIGYVITMLAICNHHVEAHKVFEYSSNPNYPLSSRIIILACDSPTDSSLGLEYVQTSCSKYSCLVMTPGDYLLKNEVVNRFNLNIYPQVKLPHPEPVKLETA